MITSVMVARIRSCTLYFAKGWFGSQQRVASGGTEQHRIHAMVWKLSPNGRGTPL